jgi:hypothetical protein
VIGLEGPGGEFNVIEFILETKNEGDEGTDSVSVFSAAIAVSVRGHCGRSERGTFTSYHWIPAL